MDAQLKTAIEAALIGGKIIKKNLGKIKKIAYKGSLSNVVTNVDKASEKAIIKHLKKVFPDYVVLAEESGGITTGCPYRWVIDPLDGTNNFAHNFPFFCVSIALEKDCLPILGVVYDPLRDELFYAQKNGGAYLNKKRISVSSVGQIEKSLIATGFAYNRIIKTDAQNIDNFVRILAVSQGIRRAGSAALDLSYVACGRFDGFWELGLSPWDTAAGMVIVTEAGGKITRISGEKYSHYDRDVLASNGKIHRQLLKLLKG